jgi:hypothetical protein
MGEMGKKWEGKEIYIFLSRYPEGITYKPLLLLKLGNGIA